jgi:hypothetical protein
MPLIDPATLRLLCELAHDGVWTLPQFDARRDHWTCPQIPPRYLTIADASLRPTGYSRLSVRVAIVRPTSAAVEIAQAHGIDVAAVRPGQLEHAVGLAELRWRSGVAARHSVLGETLLRAQNHLRALGCNESFRAVPDGAYRHEDAVVLCEYDTGRYSACQVRAKIAAGRSIRRMEGCQIIGHLWGVPTHERAKWLRDRGAWSVIVVPVSSWLPVANLSRDGAVS